MAVSKLDIVDKNGRVLRVLCTLELADKDNKRSVSRIPEGEYTVVHRHSTKFGHHFHIKNVLDRSYILFHSGNYHTQIRGCILPGLKFSHVGSTDEIDVSRSGDAMEVLHKYFDNQDTFELTITDGCFLL